MSPRPALDASHLPSVVFGQRSLTWWGTIGFMVLEGMTLLVTLFAYLFLMHHAPEWPPAGTPAPDLLVPTIGLALLLGSLAIAWWINRRAHAMDLGGVRMSLAVSSLASLVILAVRTLEFGAVHVAWDSNAYGSVVWGILVVHTLLLLTDFLESTGLLAVFLIGPVEEKHFVDASDGAFYWWFAALSWLPPYVLLYWVPRWV